MDEIITLEYLKRYPLSKRTQSWKGILVNIETEHGFWRTNCCGYTWKDHENCGVFLFEEAWNNIKDLGPEKKAKLYRA